MSKQEDDDFSIDVEADDDLEVQTLVSEFLEQEKVCIFIILDVKLSDIQ